MAAALQRDSRREPRDARADHHDVFRHRTKLARRRRSPGCDGWCQRSKTSRVLVAVASTAPSASVTTPSVKPTREPDLTTVPSR